MCSIEEAFAMFGDEPTARSERKRRKRRLLPPEPAVIEPDRPAHRPKAPAEVLGRRENHDEPFTDTPSAMLSALDVGPYSPHPSSDVDSETVYNLEPDWTKPFNNTSAPDWIKEIGSRLVADPIQLWRCENGSGEACR